MAYTGEGTGYSPSPVMTFEAGGSWLAVRVDQVDRVAVASRLWPVPLARAEHAGLFDIGEELIPVLRLDNSQIGATSDGVEQLVAVLRIRGQVVGLAIDRAGRVYERYRLEEKRTHAPFGLDAAGALPVVSSDDRFWLVDPDRLFAFAAPGASATS
jgi:chemotaxis signal transduction protein